MTSSPWFETIFNDCLKDKNYHTSGKAKKNFNHGRNYLKGFEK